jgi:hypothetical protein
MLQKNLADISPWYTFDIKLISNNFLTMEKVIKPVNGYLALLISVVLLLAAIYCFASIGSDGIMGVPGALLLFICFFIWKGLMIIQPNNARVLNLFGKYVAFS